MDKYEIEVEVVTPLFIAGANQDKVELRASSIKGVLRWWWRAMNGNLHVQQLKEKESEIFGSTDIKSSFSLRVIPTELNVSYKNLEAGKPVITSSKGKRFPISIIDYLAYGIAENDKHKKINVYKRGHIKPGSRFKLIFNFFREEYKKEILSAANLWLRYGGIGAKSRNGFGSLAGSDELKAFNFKDCPQTQYTAFSKDAKLYVFGEHKNWVDALVEVGTIYRDARLHLEPRHVWEKRRVVATPIIVKGEVNIEERHSKPYILHIDKRNNKYRGKILCLPYVYYQSIRQETFAKVYEEMCNFFINSGGKESTHAF